MRGDARSSARHLLRSCGCRAGRRGLNKSSGRYHRCQCSRCVVCLYSRIANDLASSAFCKLNSLRRTSHRCVCHAGGRSLESGLLAQAPAGSSWHTLKTPQRKEFSHKRCCKTHALVHMKRAVFHKTRAIVQKKSAQFSTRCFHALRGHKKRLCVCCWACEFHCGE